jgi:serine/threonine protein kinase
MGSTKTVAGTYGYMQPERFGDRAVPVSDPYALGTTLIYLVAGQHPADMPVVFSSLFGMSLWHPFRNRSF